jgi:8-oxo-dGTP pyrophosphatase MutT (NUDIX family)
MIYFDREAIPDIVSQLITEDMDVVLCEEDREFDAAVAIVRYHNKWLLGLAKNTGDDRNNKWIMPGGGIKSGESAEAAAVRETKEETGVKCRAISGALKDTSKKGVAFVACRASSADSSKLKPNHEFVSLEWFTEKQMESLKLYHNVERLIKKAKRHN